MSDAVTDQCDDIQERHVTQPGLHHSDFKILVKLYCIAVIADLKKGKGMHLLTSSVNESSQ